MKKFICILFSLLLLCGCAGAETSHLEEGVITPVADGVQFDLDGDGTPDPIEYEIFRDEDGFDTGYRLKVGSSEVTGEGWTMREEAHVLLLNWYTPLVMVSDYGPSDDYVTHFYLYEYGALQYAGSIDSMPESMRVENEIITAPVRGNLLYTWFHDADFALARSFGEDGQIPVVMHEIPRPMYPMSLIVTLKVDLPLFVSTTNYEVDHTLRAGEQAVLCATDDLEWVYIKSLETEAAGWMKVDRTNGHECIVGDQLLFSYDVFDGLLFAD